MKKKKNSNGVELHMEAGLNSHDSMVLHTCADTNTHTHTRDR